jgi:hypothetical protein
MCAEQQICQNFLYPMKIFGYTVLYLQNSKIMLFLTLKAHKNILYYTSDLFPYFEHPIVRGTNNKLMFVRHNGQISHKVHVGVAMGGVTIRLGAAGG